MSIVTPWFSLIMSRAFLMIVSVLRPRKSIFITPASSIMLPSICVTHRSDSFDVHTGISVVRSVGAMMIPAAWIPVFLTEPSRRSAVLSTSPSRVGPLYRSRIFLTVSISSAPSPSFSSSDCSPSFTVIGAFNTLLSVMPSLSGISFASAFDSGSGRSSVRATSLMLIFAAIVP